MTNYVQNCPKSVSSLPNIVRCLMKVYMLEKSTRQYNTLVNHFLAAGIVNFVVVKELSYQFLLLLLLTHLWYVRHNIYNSYAILMT